MQKDGYVCIIYWYNNRHWQSCYYNNDGCEKRLRNIRDMVPGITPWDKYNINGNGYAYLWA